MKRKVGLVVGFISVFALSIGYTNVLAKGQSDEEKGDKVRVVTVEEQRAYENQYMDGKDVKTTITAEEQKRVENSLALSGFIPQRHGTGFYFEKERW